MCRDLCVSPWLLRSRSLEEKKKMRWGKVRRVDHGRVSCFAFPWKKTAEQKFGLAIYFLLIAVLLWNLWLAVADIVVPYHEICALTVRLLSDRRFLLRRRRNRSGMSRAPFTRSTVFYLQQQVSVIRSEIVAFHWLSWTVGIVIRKQSCECVAVLFISGRLVGSY